MKPRKNKTDDSDNLNGVLFSPRSDWVLPPNYPDLGGEKVIAIDVESRDPELKSRGPGFIRGDAEPVGISVAAGDCAWYFPFGHLGGGNGDKFQTISWVRDLVKDTNRSIIGANLQYDLEALDSLGIEVHSRCIDIQVAEALLDEEQESYSLETLARKYLGSGKDESLLRDAASAYGVDPKSGLWKLPAKYVGPYAEHDALATLRIFRSQLDLLRGEDLLGIFELESKLLPILWKMRKQGIPIDMDAAHRLSGELKQQEDELRLRLKANCGYNLDVWSGIQIARFCDQRKIHYPRTALGNPSFTGEWLEEFSDPGVNLISRVREVNRMRQTFVDDWIFKNQVRGRIHPQWKQLASDDGGTRTGRMAAANPNPQQVPAGKFRATGKANEIGKAIRACFISDTGKWAKFDYSQQEPRILTHFAAVCDFTGAKLARMAYQNNRKMDFYQYMVEVAGIDRRPAKDMYLGRCYGMGVNKLSIKLGKSLDECHEILAKFDEMVPFVKEIQDSCERSAQKRGYIKTLLGRKRHFNFWEPMDAYRRRQDGEDVRPHRLKVAQDRWPGIKLVRADTRKALNALIQGSAADMTKAAMVALYEQHKIVPYLQVHDELDIGVHDEAHANVCHEIIENCVEMTVPVRSDLTLGKHWK